MPPSAAPAKIVLPGTEGLVWRNAGVICPAVSVVTPLEVKTVPGEDDAARTHQPGEDKQDGGSHVVSSPRLRPA